MRVSGGVELDDNGIGSIGAGQPHPACGRVTTDDASEIGIATGPGEKIEGIAFDEQDIGMAGLYVCNKALAIARR